MKECPFCGSLSAKSVDNFQMRIRLNQIGCGVCGSSTGLYATYEEARQAWEDRSTAWHPWPEEAPRWNDRLYRVTDGKEIRIGHYLNIYGARWIDLPDGFEVTHFSESLDGAGDD